MEARFKDVEHSQELCVTMWCMPGLFWCVALLDYEAHQHCVSCRPLLQPTRRPQDHLTNTSPSVVNNKFMVACFTCYVLSNSSVLSNWSLSICPTQGGACSRVQGAADDCAGQMRITRGHDPVCLGKVWRCFRSAHVQFLSKVMTQRRFVAEAMTVPDEAWNSLWYDAGRWHPCGLC